MTKKYTRRHLIFVGVVSAVVTAGTTSGALVAIRRNSADLEAEKIRLAIYAQIHRAGWKRATPDIFRAKGEENKYVTGPLPVVGGCNVTLIFDGGDGKNYKVRGYTSQDPQEYIVSVTGKDNKKYPDALLSLRNPTKQQLDRMLANAGLTQCKPLGG